MLFKQHDKSSPLNCTQYALLYPQNGDRIVTVDSMTSFHPVGRLLALSTLIWFD